MPANLGAAKADAGRFQRNREIDHGPALDGVRPSVPEIEPLYHTFNQPKPEGAYFDDEAADHAVMWIENLRHFKGRWAGRRFLLMAWQIRIVREIFGWMRPDHTRLYRLVYVEAPRKSGKTSLAAAIALYLAHGDDEAAPEIYFAAYDKDQATICYDTARYMVERDPQLYAATAIYNSKREMKLRDNPGGVMRTVSKDVGKLYGINLHAAVFDELMTQKTRELWDALTTSEGSREQSLIFAISTAGWDQQSVCFEQHELVRQIFEGNVEDESFLGVVYGAPMDADWTSEDVWARAQPSFGETTTLDYYRRKATKARNQPTEQNAFRTLLLSQWVGQAERFLDMTAWDACDGPVKEGMTAYGGIDLSATTDLTAFVVVAGEDRPRYVLPYCFLPETGVAEKEKRDRVPYRTWAEQGIITLTPGATVDYSFVKAAIEDASQRFELVDVTYDKWNATQFVRELEDEGLTLWQMGQGILQMSPPTKELLRLITEAQLQHAGHPLLRWCASNVAPRHDSAGNIKPDKERSAHRIDPIVALVMALDGWMRRGGARKRSVYEERFRAA